MRQRGQKMKEPGFRVCKTRVKRVEIPFSFALYKDGELLEEEDMTTAARDGLIRYLVQGWASRNGIDRDHQDVLETQIKRIRDDLRRGLPWYNPPQ